MFECIYGLRYEDGNEGDFVNFDLDLHEIVLHACENLAVEGAALSPEDSILLMGTPVCKHFPGYSWCAGTISAFYGVYLVRHDDGDEEELFYDSPQMQALVAEATVA
jgi:hypothetical protein